MLEASKQATDHANQALTNVTATRVESSVTISGKTGTKRVGKHLCIESWHADDYSLWYRIYDDGWKECGGKANSNNDNAVYVNLPVTYLTQNSYDCLGSYADTDGYPLSYCRRMSNSQILLRWPTKGNKYVQWRCAGY